MSTTGLATFDRTLQATNIWLNELSTEFDWDDKHKSFQVLRATLHALRDRLSVDQASKLASQLPVLLAGFFYQDWKPAETPHKERTKAAFLSHIDSQLQPLDLDIDAEQAVRSVFKVVAKKVSAGEIEDVKSMLPKPLKELWPSMTKT